MPAKHISEQEIANNRAKLAERFGNTTRIGGSQRRRKQANHKSGANEDKKLSATLKHCGAQNIPGMQEVNFFHEDGTITHFASPKLQVAPACNTYAVTGKAETKDFKDMLPDILTQLGTGLFDPKSMPAPAPAAPAAADDEVPDLVENFEETSKN